MNPGWDKLSRLQIHSGSQGRNRMHRQPPVVIAPYDPAWPEKFETESGLLKSVLAQWLMGPIEHVGSTAVPGLLAKPVIDIMAAVRDLPALSPLRKPALARPTCVPRPLEE